jgi:hypothetical protein
LSVIFRSWAFREKTAIKTVAEVNKVLRIVFIDIQLVLAEKQLMGKIGQMEDKAGFNISKYNYFEIYPDKIMGLGLSLKVRI